jgi:hypothetical protein
MQPILESTSLLIIALVAAVAFVLSVMPRQCRARRFHQTGRLETPRRTPPKNTTRGRRTNLVTDDEWQAFREVKAGITGQKGEAAVARQLALLGAPTLHDVILEDSLGLTQIDHLVLGRDAILVLETKTYSGFVAGDPNSQEWTQYLPRGATRTNFHNPLRQNYRHCAATSEIVRDPNVLVRGFVVSAGKARFDDALAGVVVELDGLPDILLPNDGSRADQTALRLAWERLIVAAQAGEARRAEHLASVRSKRGMAA